MTMFVLLVLLFGIFCDDLRVTRVYLVRNACDDVRVTSFVIWDFL